MNVKIEFPGTDAQGRVFLSWTPVKATAKIVDSTGAAVDIILRSAGTVGGLLFDTVRSDEGTPESRSACPPTASLSFWVAGEFQKPSSAYGDAVVQATDKTTGTVLGSKALMVRVRKNAQTLPAPERDRFLGGAWHV